MDDLRHTTYWVVHCKNITEVTGWLIAEILLTGWLILEMMSCGHMEGVRAEKGPPGVGVKLVALFTVGMALMLIPSPQPDTMMSSSSSSDNVSTEKETMT